MFPRSYFLDSYWPLGYFEADAVITIPEEPLGGGDYYVASYWLPSYFGKHKAPVVVQGSYFTRSWWC